ncbi:MAG: hypothetical protein ABIG10_00765 [bacterium]
MQNIEDSLVILINEYRENNLLYSLSQTKIPIIQDQAIDLAASTMNLVKQFDLKLRENYIALRETYQNSYIEKLIELYEKDSIKPILTKKSLDFKLNSGLRITKKEEGFLCKFIAAYYKKIGHDGFEKRKEYFKAMGYGSLKELCSLGTPKSTAMSLFTGLKKSRGHNKVMIKKFPKGTLINIVCLKDGRISLFTVILILPPK